MATSKIPAIPALASRALSLLENDVPSDRRYSVLHHGLKLMLDHLLVSQALKRLHRRADIVNNTLMDEHFGMAQGRAAMPTFFMPRSSQTSSL